jgi:hypothetical protein
METMNMNRETFINLTSAEIAAVLQKSGSKACVFPINGSRRWFLLEHGLISPINAAQTYAEAAGKRHAEIYQMFFEYGVDTLIAPVFGSEILNRGDEYMETIGISMSRLSTHPDFLSLYKKYQVRVHFYGDYRRQLANTPYSYLSDQFDHITQHTAKHTRHRIFYGVFASDATDTIAQQSVQFFRKNGRVPTRRELIETYYGEYIEKANLFIGFEKFNVFDYPMLNWGEESLYFTVAPSLYLTQNQLCSILYDYMYLRPTPAPDYTEMPEQDFESMRQFYTTHRETIFGTGEMRGGIWYPSVLNNK